MATTVSLQCVFLMMLSLVFTRGQNLNCTVPQSAACSIDPHPVNISCTVLTRHDPQANVTVRWYWSGDQGTAGVRGTLLTNSSKYVLQYAQASTSIHSTDESGPNALYNDHSTLTIFDFTSTDFGYYWCQTVVNGSCLIPSPYGHISENTTAGARPCSLTVFNILVWPLICAGSDTSPDNCSEVHILTTGVSLPVQCQASRFYSTLGVLVFVIVLQMGVIILLCLTVLTYKKKFKRGVDLLELQPLRDHGLQSTMSSPVTDRPGFTSEQEEEEEVEYSYPTVNHEVVRHATESGVVSEQGALQSAQVSKTTEQHYENLNTGSMDYESMYNVASATSAPRNATCIVADRLQGHTHEYSISLV